MAIWVRSQVASRRDQNPRSVFIQGITGTKEALFSPAGCVAVGHKEITGYLWVNMSHSCHQPEGSALGTDVELLRMMQILCLPWSSLLRIESLPCFHQTATVYDQGAQRGGGSSWIWVSTTGRLTVPHGNVRDSPWGCDKMTNESCLRRKSLSGISVGYRNVRLLVTLLQVRKQRHKYGWSAHFLLHWQSRTPAHGMEPLTFQTDLPPLITLSRNSLTNSGLYTWWPPLAATFYSKLKSLVLLILPWRDKHLCITRTPKFGLNTQYYTMPFHLHVYVKEGLIKSGELMLGQI